MDGDEKTKLIESWLRENAIIVVRGPDGTALPVASLRCTAKDITFDINDPTSGRRMPLILSLDDVHLEERNRPAPNDPSGRELSVTIIGASESDFAT